MFTTSAIRTCASAPADAFAAAPPRAADAGYCTTTPSHARRIRGPQDRAEIVRILDAVEHDEQRHRRRARAPDRRRLYSSRSSTSATTP